MSEESVPGGYEATGVCRHCLEPITLWPIMNEENGRMVKIDTVWIHDGHLELCPGPGTKAEPLPPDQQPPDDSALMVGVDPPKQMVVVQHPRLPRTPNGSGYINFSPAQAREFAGKLQTHADSLDPLGGLLAAAAPKGLEEASTLFRWLIGSREYQLHIAGTQFDSAVRSWLERYGKPASASAPDKV